MLKKKTPVGFEFMAKLVSLVSLRWKKNLRVMLNLFQHLSKKKILKLVQDDSHLEHTFALVKKEKKREKLAGMIGSRRKLLTSGAMLLIIVVLVATLAPGDLKAQNYNKQWTSTADFNTGTNSNIDTSNNQAQLAATTNSAYSEGFTNTTNKDAATDANWDTTNHKITLPGDPSSGVATDLQAKWKATTGTDETISSTVYDSTNHYIYAGGSQGSFMAYSPTSQNVVNLTSKLTSWGAYPVGQMIFDSADSKVFICDKSGNNRFGSFTGGSDPANGTWVYLYSKINSGMGNTNNFNMAYDSTNAKIYLGGGYNNTTSLSFGVFTGLADPANGTFTSLTSKMAGSWGNNNISAMSFDSTNGTVYIGGYNAMFGCYLGGVAPANGTFTYLTSKISADWAYYYGINAISFDSANAKIYLAGDGNKFGAYSGGPDPANGTWTYLSSKIGVDFAGSSINTLGFDSVNSKIYIAGNNGKFGAYSAGAVPNSGTWTNLTSKISSVWSASDALSSLSFDGTDSLVFLGGVKGKFGSYTAVGNPSTGSFESLSASLSNTLVGYSIDSSATDLAHGIIYLSGGTGVSDRLIAYLVSTGTVIDLTAKISSVWTWQTIRLSFDSTNSKLYMAGQQAYFGCFSGGSDPINGTYVDLTSKISSTWSGNEIYALVFDSANNLTYLAGYSGRFGVFSGGADPANGTWTNLTSKISSDWSTAHVKSLVFDSTSNKVYLGGSSAKFGAFSGGADPANGTWTYLTPKISADWSTDEASSLAYDSVNGKVFIGGTNGKFGAFSGGADPANGTWTYLTPKISADWSSTNFSFMFFASGKIYMGGYSGKFGVFTGGANPANGTWNYLYTNISAINGSYDISTITYIPSAATIYIGSKKGKFTSFLIGYASNKNGISNAIDSTTQPIGKATLTATASTPANTDITYYLSNDGGAHWNAVTSGVEYTFTTTTSDLRWKANLTTTDASVTPQITGIAISYTYLTSNSGTMSLVYDASQAVVPTLLSWNSTLPANTTMTFKVRSAATSGGLAAATWSDTKNAADTPVNLKTINVGGVAGVPENQFSEVYITLTTSDGLSTPVLADITEQYVINAAPELDSLTASQSTDGSKTVNITYNLKDSDSHTNPYNQDGVVISYQYSVDSGATWHDCSTVTNSGLLAVNSNNTWKAESAVWNVGTDLAGTYYNGTVKIKVKANDNEQAHNTAELVSTAFSLDTKNPTTNAISGGGVGIKINDGSAWTNNPVVNLTLSATDDGTKYMEVRNDNSFVGAKSPYSTSASNYSLSSADGAKTVYVRFYDAMGNSVDANANILLDTTAPAVPAHFTVFDTSDQKAGTFSSVVVWNPVNNPGDFSKYSLERSTDSGSTWSELATFSNIASNAYSDMGLSNSTTYVYRMRSLDIHTNYSSYTDNKELKPAGVDTVPPEITGTGPTPEAADTTATISWTTDKPSDSYVEYGTTTNYGSIQGTDDLVVNHVVHLVGLNPTTTYQFRVKCRDASGNRVVSSNQSFTTTLPADAASGVNITGSTAQKPGADPEEVTIIWTTDRYATGQVYFGTTETNLDMRSDLDSTLNKTHFVNIAHLNPNTKYYYKAYSKDTYGNEVWGEAKYFVTAQSGLSTPTIIKVQATDTTMTSSIISWQTTTVATSVVEIGDEAGTYNNHIEDKSTGATTQHVVRLSDLTSGKEYHYRVLGQGTDQRWVASDDYTVATVPVPVISEFAVKDVKSDGATISWKTNSPTDSFVNFGTDSTDNSQGKSELASDHLVTISSLKPAVTYKVQAKSRDAYSNIAASDQATFTTTADVTAPKIDNLKNQMSVITSESGDAKVQAIITWMTDEPATTMLKYSEGIAISGNYANSTQEDSALVTSHVVILNNLKPSTTYHMQTISKDGSGNIAISKDYVVLTKRQDKSLLQTVVAQLQQSFGWVNKIKLFSGK